MKGFLIVAALRFPLLLLELGVTGLALADDAGGLLGGVIRSFLICLLIPAVIFDRDHRGLHDLAAKTVVVRR